MTHTLHRYRKNRKDDGDFVFLCTPAVGKNHLKSGEKMVRILDLVLKYEPTNINFYENRSSIANIDEIKSRFNDTSRIRCCFSHFEKIKSLLAEIKEGNFGLSVCVSGPLWLLDKLSAELNLPIHSVNLSCGFYGKKQKLPGNDVLEVTSMCGHGLIASALVETLFCKLSGNEIQPGEALGLINQQCICGLVNKEKLGTICKDKFQVKDKMDFLSLDC